MRAVFLRQLGIGGAGAAVVEELRDGPGRAVPRSDYRKGGLNG